MKSAQILFAIMVLVVSVGAVATSKQAIAMPGRVCNGRCENRCTQSANHAACVQQCVAKLWRS